MDWIFFLQIVTAVMLGNGLTVLFIYVCWRINRQERLTGSHEGLPPWVYFVGLVPFAFAFAGFFFMPH
jgi:uncharacterized membrane protein YdcZ (DUF606 family)